MSRICKICGKKPIVGHNVSHANNKSKRRWYPNLQKLRCVDERTGTVNGRRGCAFQGKNTVPYCGSHGCRVFQRAEVWECFSGLR